MESIWCTIQNLVYLNEVFVIEYSSRDHLMPYMVLTINAINKYIDFFFFSRRIKCNFKEKNIKLQQVPIFKTFLYSSYWEHTLYINYCSFNSFKFENLWKKIKNQIYFLSLISAHKSLSISKTSQN